MTAETSRTVLAKHGRSFFWASMLLPRDQAAATFEYLEPEVQESLIHALGRDRVASILNNMSPDDRTALLEELPAGMTRRVLQMLSPEERRTAITLIGYPEDSIGRLMTPEYIAIHEGWSIQKALDHIRKHGEDSETLNVIYVTDERGKLQDDLRIRELLLADPGARIGDVTSSAPRLYGRSSVATTCVARCGRSRSA